MKIGKVDYIFNLIKATVIAVIRKVVGRSRFKRRKYNGKKIMCNELANKLLKKKIEEGKPFVAARFGDTELRTVVCYLNRKILKKQSYPHYIREAVSNCSGFFPPTDEAIDEFAKLMLQSCKKVDVLAVWFNLLEDYVYKKFGPSKGTCIYLKALEPFWYDIPWTMALKGKKVLVIHPFADTIEKQYKNRQNLFKNENVLPEFELFTLKAVQSLGGNSDEFESWFEALEWMYTESLKIEFDIAIIGCGAYGMPLAAKIRDAGRMVVHMGGATQLLFGIKGARWDLRPDYVALYNDYWCRPADKEKPKTAAQVEGGCYW